MFLKLVDDTNMITNARCSVGRCWQGWELVTFRKRTDESESTYWSGFSSAAGASPRPAGPRAAATACVPEGLPPRPPSPSLIKQRARELGPLELRTQGGAGAGSPRGPQQCTRGLTTRLFIPEDSRDSRREGGQRRKRVAGRGAR